MSRTKAESGKIYSLEKMTIRDVILERLEELGIARNELARSGICTASPSTIFRFLAGEKDALCGSVEQLLRACGIKLIAIKKTPDWLEDD